MLHKVAGLCLAALVVAGSAEAQSRSTLLSQSRLDSLSRAKRMEWTRYIERSRERYILDTIAMRAELKTVGRDTLARAPHASGFQMTKEMTPAWFAGDSAQQIARNILSFQAPNGGWSKKVDVMTRARLPGESFFSETNRWQWISTIDNASTTSQQRFLGMADAARPNAEYRASFLRGLDYLLAAQYPNGCWPQIWPLQGSYHDAVTFNDDALVNVARLLRDIGGGAFEFVPARRRADARKAAARGTSCILASQVKVRGKLTAWGQQHDPLTLEPVSARSYELTSLSSQESAAILRYLMEIPAPSTQVVQAVHAAADWLTETRLYGVKYTFDAGAEKSEGAGPVWARMNEIGSNRPIFSNRDGIRLYDWNELTDRRTGYGWYSYAPVAALSRYERWAPKHPRQK